MFRSALDALDVLARLKDRDGNGGPQPFGSPYPVPLHLTLAFLTLQVSAAVLRVAAPPYTGHFTAEVSGSGAQGVLHAFVEQEALPGTARRPAPSWNGLAGLVRIAPRNRDLLDLRDQLQSRIDEYHRANAGKPWIRGYERFLREIGYLRAEPADFSIRHENVDDEIARIAGPHSSCRSRTRAMR